MVTNPDLSQEVNRLHADICSALADPRRIMILYTLVDGPINVGDLTQALNISQSAVSRHLKVLRERGLVHAVRNGASIEYSLADKRLIEALDLLRMVLRDRLTYNANLIDQARSAKTE